MAPDNARDSSIKLANKFLCSCPGIESNHDPLMFENPEVFDITRSPDRHMGFGMGVHYCLGASLARLEVKIALSNLLVRNPNLRLAVPVSKLERVNVPLQTRYRRVPVVLG